MDDQRVENEEIARPPAIPAIVATPRWLVLRMAAPRTLKVAEALQAIGIPAWTPQGIERRRRPRSNKYLDIKVALLPGFVFADSERLVDLIGIAHGERRHTPAFTILQANDRFPTTSAQHLQPLREFEARTAEQWAKHIDAVEKQAKKSRKKSAARAYVIGQRVKVERIAFAGLVGTIREIRSNGDLALEFTGFVNGTVVPSCDVSPIQLSGASSERDKAA